MQAFNANDWLLEWQRKSLELNLCNIQPHKNCLLIMENWFVSLHILLLYFFRQDKTLVLVFSHFPHVR